MAPLDAQGPPANCDATRPRAEPPHAALRRIGGDDDDRWRARQLTGTESVTTYLLRSPSTMGESPMSCGEPGRTRVWLVPVDGTLAYNARLPYTRNLDGLWAGRGVSARLGGGLRFARGPFRATLAPSLRVSQNAGFEVAPAPYYAPPIPPDYSPYASPWNVSPFVGARYSIDEPVRFGDEPLVEADAGESGIWVRGTRLTLGVTTEHAWWGPGIRNSLLLSNNAPGVPRLELRTSAPLTGRAGTLEAHWFTGSLRESRVFNTHPEDDRQYLSALALSWRPPRARGVEVGMARVVFGPSELGSQWLRPFEVFRSVGRPDDRPRSDTTHVRAREQLTSVFARLRIPEDSFSVHIELGRAQEPVNLRDFLTEMTHSLAYTVGVEYARGWRGGPDLLRIQLEATSLEQSSTYLHRPTPSWYTSRALRQGYTNRGRTLGAAIGPGSSGQWLAVDLLRPEDRLGIFLSRSRWNTDAMLLLPFPPGTGFCEFDVTVSPGIRGARRLGRAGTVSAEVMLSKRYNVFFNNVSGCPAGPYRRDAFNPGLTMSFAPAAW